ncbi:MAG: phenylalanine--tRNA ligase subunit beta, partial [Oscillospiraceae bacterium]
MLISTNWLSDFVDLKGVNLKELINRFTLSTAEVEEIYEYGKNIENVVAAKIVSVKNHENSKKLHILQVDDGEKTVQVICGAPNVREGMIVAFARAGGMVCGQKIEVCKVAGVESFGMCCSEKELGISDEHSGIMDLPADTVLGTSIKELFPIDDVVFEVDNKSLTNRPDLWGHYGIAREVSALIDRPLKPIELFDTSVADNLTKVDICVEDKEKCFRYSGITIKNITQKSAPMEMKIRLFYCGMRSLNLLADLTNYLMLELGQPMHAFDNNIVSKISVRSVSSKFTFKTLDDVEREIPENTLMICQGENPVAIAGIMGGNNSSISDDTTSVLLESANFDGVCVRKTATKIGLRTEASARYEKALDPELTMVALKRFVKLLKDIDDGAEITSSV